MSATTTVGSSSTNIYCIVVVADAHLRCTAILYVYTTAAAAAYMYKLQI